MNEKVAVLRYALMGGWEWYALFADADGLGEPYIAWSITVISAERAVELAQEYGELHGITVLVQPEWLERGQRYFLS
ncbi:MAG TPA: hypothetical protein VFS21_29630 [Roseiflexaceae bacterium]|nr:hypothetical protein [Roseiflexaceae bacterium]